MLRPGDEAALAEMVAAATGPLAIRGGGTRQGLGRGVTGEALDLGAIAGITLYEPGALTLVVKAGTPLPEVEAALAAEGQRLPFEPMDHRGIYRTNGVPTIGGMVATGAAGPRRIQAGSCRDSMIGVRFVNGRGEIVKNGGRVMKNVTGYDLVKLMAGSHGTLGILTEVAFKVLPAAEAAASIMIRGLDDAGAIAAMSRALTSPFDVSGAAHLPGTADGVSLTAVRVEGLAGSVAYRAGRLKDLLAPFGDVAVEDDPARVAALWASVRDAAPLADGAGDIWRISVKPGDGAAARAALGSDAEAFLDWGGGLIWARVPEGRDVRAALAAIPGHATLVRGSEATKAGLGVFHPEPAPLALIGAGLRAQFDPRGILNPGRMG